MFTYKEAARIAEQNLKEMYPEADDFLLEELEMDEDKRFWYITVSFPNISLEQADAPLAALFKKPDNRHFKTLKIDAETGEFVSMKRRVFQV